MATIGQQYTAPEAGWQRIDEVNPYIKYVGTWNVENLFANYGGTAKYTSDINARVFFNFNGTKLRIIGGLYNGRTTKAEVYIDGVLKGTINESTATGIAQVLVFETTGLSSGKHQVEIRMTESKQFIIDAIEIDSTGSMAGGLIGVPLTAPEAGWKRYDDRNPAIKYTGTWNVATGDARFYNGTVTWINTPGGSSIRFRFKGTKIRIIGTRYQDRSSNIQIKIDGVVETYSEYKAVTTAEGQILVYEKIGLPDAIHDVEITTTSGSYSLDAIDIDDTGRLLHPDEVTDIADLDVGKRIRCHYQASSGQVGIFSGLGQETSDFIPPASSATPNGDFYWICVDKTNSGGWKLIADRNIQHSISWDKINEQGMTNTGREITF